MQNGRRLVAENRACQNFYVPVIFAGKNDFVFQSNSTAHREVRPPNTITCGRARLQPSRSAWTDNEPVL